ncbi:MFS transporter [Natrarchaeobius chitinivorans]|uniref:MFS transporter n=1 Tax=Natrarchaeobius chitinivorans TaxID=1679083 RepID=A0A3N6MNS5_NATCH|nr:MFS transporter [Natrarchaeobius chitinivorans]RQG97781.1 MFS transporter [Natrarchaeobius chitinivorans]
MDVGDTLKREVRALWADGTGLALGAVATTWGLLIGTRMILPVVLPSIQETFDLSLTVAGLLVTILWLGGAIGQLPGGMLADKYDERTLMATSAVVVGVALVAFVFAPSAVVLFGAAAVWGLAHSLYPIARITLLSNLYPDRLGSALGVTMATGDVGQTALPPLGAVLAGAIAWQAGLGFVIPLLVAFGVLILMFVPKTSSPDDDNGSGRSLEGVRAVVPALSTPSMGFITLILFLYIFIWQSFTAFYPTYLITVKGIQPAIASALFGLFFAVGVVVKPIAGGAYDRIGIRGSLVGVLAAPVGGFFLLPFVDELWALALITALVSTMLGSGAITQSYLAESFPEELRGTGLGVVRTVTATVGAGGPLVFGAIGDYGYFDEGYWALAAIMAVIVLLTLAMPTTSAARN